MERIIRQITEHFLDQLDPETKYYRLDDLRSGIMPHFLVDRIEMSLVSYLHDTLEPPSTHWADLDNDEMKTAWAHFLGSAERKIRLPKIYARSVIESSVEDLLWMLVEPRSSLPVYLFEKKQKLEKHELESRLEWVVVYRHFARAILRYMDKKGLEVLTEQQCRRIVTTVDQRLAEKYDTAGWMQLLEPWFEMMDEQVFPDLLGRFFREKEKTGWAAVFNGRRERLDRSGVLSVLEESDSASTDTVSIEEKAEHAEENTLHSAFEARSPERMETARNGAENGAAGWMISEEEEPESEEPDDSLNRQFSVPEEEAEGYEPEAVDEKGEQETPDSADLMKQKETGVSEEETEETPDAFRAENGEDSEGGDSEEETPMWKRFMSPEDLEEMEAREAEAEEDEEQEEVPVNTGATDDVEPGSETGLNPELSMEERRRGMFKHLSVSKARFVKKIFGGSDRAYEEAIHEIAAFDDWADAAHFIDEEVFTRNMVDMYSEAAVDFTDLLHAYFKRNQNKN